MNNFILKKEVDVSLGPFVLNLELLEKISIGGFLGQYALNLFVRYPSETEKSFYAAVEPFVYKVKQLYHLISVLIVIIYSLISSLIYRFGWE